MLVDELLTLLKSWVSCCNRAFTAYYPDQDRSASGVFENWGINLAYNSAYNILKEFYPDFLRLVSHRHGEPRAATNAATAPAAAAAAAGMPIAQPANP